MSIINKIFGSPSPQSTTSTQSPWKPQQPYLQSLFNRAENIYKRPTFSPETLSAMQQQTDRAMSGNNLTTQAQAQWGKTIAGDYLDPNSNPYLASAVSAALDPVQGRVNATFGAGGGNNFGSSAHSETLAKQLASTALPYYMQNYQTERGRQLEASQMAPAMAYADLDPLYQVGQMKTQAPWEKLGNYQNAVAGQYGSQSTQPYFPSNPYMNILGLGVSAYGAHNLGKS